jgi:ribulose bisphosphate carboxylase small subunit
MRKYLVYKTINTINEKFYIGAHETDDEDDSYLGSGILLNKAIKKYGKDLFKREILIRCSSSEEMFNEEQRLISEHIENPLCYNLKKGGIGGWDYVNRSGLNRGSRNPMKNLKIRKKCLCAAKKTKEKNPEKYRLIAIENLKKATEKNIGTTKSDFFKKTISKKSKQYWKKNKEKMQNALSSWFKVIAPNGEEYTTNRLENFCTERKLPYTTLWKTSKTGITANRGPSKGWKCQKITQI